MSDSSTKSVMNTTAETFHDDVFVRSRSVPVVVDFWAPWCGPCRALGPILEKLASEAGGAWILVKANTDELQEAATKFNVSGIPAVFAVIDEQVVDYFSGALPEPHVKQWLERVMAAGALQSAKRLELEAPTEAEAKYRKILTEDPRNVAAKFGLARVLFAKQNTAEVQQILQDLEDTGYLDAEGQRMKAALALQANQDLDLDEIRGQAKSNPKDLQLQFRLAEALTGAKEFEEALELLLSLVQRDKKGIGQQARDFMVQILQALPEDSELASNYRRKLSQSLY